jgi:hypothetical protein
LLLGIIRVIKYYTKHQTPCQQARERLEWGNVPEAFRGMYDMNDYAGGLGMGSVEVDPDQAEIELCILLPETPLCEVKVRSAAELRADLLKFCATHCPETPDVQGIDILVEQFSEPFYAANVLKQARLNAVLMQRYGVDLDHSALRKSHTPVRTEQQLEAALFVFFATRCPDRLNHTGLLRRIVEQNCNHELRQIEMNKGLLQRHGADLDGSRMGVVIAEIRDGKLQTEVQHPSTSQTIGDLKTVLAGERGISTKAFALIPLWEPSGSSAETLQRFEWLSTAQSAEQQDAECSECGAIECNLAMHPTTVRPRHPDWAVDLMVVLKGSHILEVPDSTLLGSQKNVPELLLVVHQEHNKLDVRWREQEFWPQVKDQVQRYRTLKENASGRIAFFEKSTMSIAFMDGAPRQVVKEGVTVRSLKVKHGLAAMFELGNEQQLGDAHVPVPCQGLYQSSLGH